MELSKDLPEEVSLNQEDEEWIHQIDYEQLPFHCRICHEYGNFGRNYPKGSREKPTSKHEGDNKQDNEGFKQVKSRTKVKNSGGPKPHKETPGKAPTSSNPFQVLGKNDLGKEQIGEDVMAKSQEDKMEEITSGTGMNIQTDVMEKDEAKEMELGELDMDVFEKECEKAGKGYVS